MRSSIISDTFQKFFVEFVSKVPEIQIYFDGFFDKILKNVRVRAKKQFSGFDDIMGKAHRRIVHQNEIDFVGLKLLIKYAYQRKMFIKSLRSF
jgi:hypothetical protein